MARWGCKQYLGDAWHMPFWLIIIVKGIPKCLSKKVTGEDK